MTTHSNILAWTIPWTEEPGGLQSTGGKESDTTQWLSMPACKDHFGFSAYETRYRFIQISLATLSNIIGGVYRLPRVSVSYIRKDTLHWI